MTPSEARNSSHWLRETFTTATIEKRLGHKYYDVNGRPSPLLRHELLKVGGFSVWSSLVRSWNRSCPEFGRMLSGVGTDVVRSWNGCCSGLEQMLFGVETDVVWSWNGCCPALERVLFGVALYLRWSNDYIITLELSYDHNRVITSSYVAVCWYLVC